MFSLSSLLVITQQFHHIVCGNAGLTDTKIVGWDQNGTPVVWKTHPYHLPQALYSGNDKGICWPKAPRFTADPDFKVESGAHLLLQVWFTYNEGGFDGKGSASSAGRAGATQLDESQWGRVLHNIDWVGIKPVLRNNAGISSLDDQMHEAESIIDGTSGSSGTTDMSTHTNTRVWPGTRKEKHNTAYLSVDASDVARWETVEICFRISPKETKALLMHVNMLAWKTK